jgi:hypothetical protein
VSPGVTRRTLAARPSPQTARASPSMDEAALAITALAITALAITALAITALAITALAITALAITVGPVRAAPRGAGGAGGRSVRPYPALRCSAMSVASASHRSGIPPGFRRETPRRQGRPDLRTPRAQVEARHQGVDCELEDRAPALDLHSPAPPTTCAGVWRPVTPALRALRQRRANERQTSHRRVLPLR